MARNNLSKPYTGRGGRWRGLLIALVVLSLAVAFFAYTYRTDAEFNSAVRALVQLFSGSREAEPPAIPAGAGAGLPQTPDRPADPQQNEPPADPPEPHGHPAGATAASGLLLYLSPEQLLQPEHALGTAVQQGFGGILVDLKLTGGAIPYASNLDNAAVRPALAAQTYDLTAVAALCSDKGLTLAGRLSAFADHGAPAHIANSGTMVSGGVLFLDGNYRRSLDPYKQPAVDYIILILEEAASLGVQEILIADLSFPAVGKLHLISYPASPSRQQQLLTCFNALADAAAKAGVALTVELPARALLDTAYAETSGYSFTQEVTALCLTAPATGAAYTDNVYPTQMAVFEAALPMLSEQTAYSLWIAGLSAPEAQESMERLRLSRMVVSLPE